MLNKGISIWFLYATSRRRKQRTKSDEIADRRSKVCQAEDGLLDCSLVFWPIKSSQTFLALIDTGLERSAVLHVVIIICMAIFRDHRKVVLGVLSSYVKM